MPFAADACGKRWVRREWQRGHGIRFGGLGFIPRGSGCLSAGARGEQTRSRTQDAIAASPSLRHASCTVTLRRFQATFYAMALSCVSYECPACRRDGIPAAPGNSVSMSGLSSRAEVRRCRRQAYRRAFQGGGGRRTRRPAGRAPAPVTLTHSGGRSRFDVLGLPRRAIVSSRGDPLTVIGMMLATES